MKMTVLYYSRTGNTRKMANVIAEGMRKVPGAETGVFSIDDIDADFLNESNCMVIGTPIYAASMAGQVKMWFDEKAHTYKIPGKIGGAFATMRYVQGGGTVGLDAMICHMMVMGLMVYSGGVLIGKPGIHLGPIALADHLNEARDLFLTFGERIAKKTIERF